MQFNFIQLFKNKKLHAHMRSRDRIEIMSRILEAAAKNEQSGGGATKTRLMYRSFLTHTQLKQYLSILANSGLLQYDSISGRFKTTEKGLRSLKAYREIDQMTKGPAQRPQTNSDQVIPGLF
jgi:predicted transcriptional regulator